MILVSGATGTVGGEVVRALAAAGEPVRGLTRHARGGEPWPAGVEMATGDLDAPEDLAAAFEGVRGLFVLSGFGDPSRLFSVARAAGVERVVLLSSGSTTDADVDAVRDGVSPHPNVVVRFNAETDRALRDSGLAWTVLRPNGFHSNALRWLPQLRAGDVVRGPWADVAIASLDPADIAAVASLALTSDGHAGRAHRLTGPEALRPAERVAILAEVLGRPLRFAAQNDEEARAEMLEAMPAEYVDAFFRFFSDAETDETTVLATVEEITGRTPRRFAQWAAAHAAEFA